MMSSSPRPSVPGTVAGASDETVTSSPGLPLSSLMQQLMQERQDIEEYARTTYASLNTLRQAIRTEKMAFEAEQGKLSEQHQAQLKKALEERNQARASFQKLRADLEARQAQVQQLEGEREQLQQQVQKILQDCELQADEAAQSRRQLEEEQKRGSEIGAFLSKLEAQVRGQAQPLMAEIERLKAECGRLNVALQTSQKREQNLRERMSKPEDLTGEKQAIEKERQELAERLQLVDQIENELRKQKAAMQTERDQLARERLQRGPAEKNAVVTPTWGSSHEAILMKFTCSNCAKEVQVSARRAGLVSKCPHCSKMVPVPKQ